MEDSGVSFGKIFMQKIVELSHLLLGFFCRSIKFNFTLIYSDSLMAKITVTTRSGLLVKLTSSTTT